MRLDGQRCSAELHSLPPTTLAPWTHSADLPIRSPRLCPQLPPPPRTTHPVILMARFRSYDPGPFPPETPFLQKPTPLHGIVQNNGMSNPWSILFVRRSSPKTQPNQSLPPVLHPFYQRHGHTVTFDIVLAHPPSLFYLSFPASYLHRQVSLVPNSSPFPAQGLASPSTTPRPAFFVSSTINSLWTPSGAPPPQVRTTDVLQIDLRGSTPRAICPTFGFSTISTHQQLPHSPVLPRALILSPAQQARRRFRIGDLLAVLLLHSLNASFAPLFQLTSTVHSSWRF
ncbi:hypothetical protein OF83DRAFT_675407 [Amylostereum chailletii]|nr:hypothetical protein OF83DRAFT_675407 [Amylostereum chailletii]